MFLYLCSVVGDLELFDLIQDVEGGRTASWVAEVLVVGHLRQICSVRGKWGFLIIFLT